MKGGNPPFSRILVTGRSGKLLNNDKNKDGVDHMVTCKSAPAAVRDESGVGEPCNYDIQRPLKVAILGDTTWSIR